MNVLKCEFHCGPETYPPGEESSVETVSSGEGTIATVWLVQTSGVKIVRGEANQLGDEVELVYHSVDYGELCFEQYSCELTFTLPGVPYVENRAFTLRNTHESKPLRLPD